MKYYFLNLLLTAALLFPVHAVQAQKWVGANGVARIEVIDFHSTHRCKTCLTIESIARNVVEAEFAEEMKAGKVRFVAVDVDDRKNAALAEQFEASGTALFVYNGKTGQAYDLTDPAFSYALSNEAKLREAVRNAIKNSLTTL